MTSPMLPVAREVNVGGGTWPLLCNGNIWVEESLVNSNYSIALTQDFMCTALANTAPGQLNVMVYDERLTGFAAPFKELNEGGRQLLDILSSKQDLALAITRLKEQVRSTYDMMQGTAPTLADFREHEDYPMGGYTLLVVAANYSLLPKDIQVNLDILATAGPRAGVSIIMHSLLPDDEVMKNIVLKPYQHAWIPQENYYETNANDIIAVAHNITEKLKDPAYGTDSILFNTVENLSDDVLWQGSSIDGVTFSVGRYGKRNVEITLGDSLNQRHNALITGAVGQGKSNLISVIIHSLCQRYSPQELELYLLDFKEGVTLQPFCQQADGAYLPQARAIGLEADREFGLSVLEHLFDEHRKRLKLFKEAGAQNIYDYRKKTGIIISRIVLIIDEFQMMIDSNDEKSRHIASLLTNAVRLFRAAGIHIILASQTIGNSMALMGGENTLLAQVPIRIALKNSVSESRATLGMNNEAAAYLRPHETIVNLNYGNPKDNDTVNIAYAGGEFEEQTLLPLRRKWWQYAINAHMTRPPFVFDGERDRDWQSDASLAVPDISGSPVVLAGGRIEVDSEPLAIPLGRDAGRNIALFGSGEHVPVELMGFALALARQSKEHAAHFVILDAMLPDPSRPYTCEQLRNMLQAQGVQVDLVDRRHITKTIQEIAAQHGLNSGSDALLPTVDWEAAADANTDFGADFDATKFGLPPQPSSDSFSNTDTGRSTADIAVPMPSLDVNGPSAPTSTSHLGDESTADEMETYIFGFGLDRVGRMPEEFSTLCDQGPTNGIHVLGWWRKYSAFEKQMGIASDGLDFFDARIAFQTDQRTIGNITGDPAFEYTPEDNRALAWDASNMNEPAIIIPYATVPLPIAPHPGI
ncbi:AAA family ATPase [Bifidobacterium imperatoris]|uniref:AAA family ATPase n=1 Tax=Bifidobacterium imperatoris TaxID=2020965 RepID=A0A2N5ISH4_9BIFI|nr:FtsK/SpoIIIE domain-containing protein [Bifidobacterium imperatoris]PLS24909.1 cell division protein FtsK [Bifidobacterium imperatoris]QSY56856.1 AAA family ATPase [Bifidobacterium imperatoris]